MDYNEGGEEEGGGATDNSSLVIKSTFSGINMYTLCPTHCVSWELTVQYSSYPGNLTHIQEDLGFGKEQYTFHIQGAVYFTCG